MLTEYDDQGNYKYPEGFDPETGEWKEGFDDAARQVGGRLRGGPGALGAAQEAGRRGGRGEDRRCSGGCLSFSSEDTGSTGGGTLADDESLAALARSSPATPNEARWSSEVETESGRLLYGVGRFSRFRLADGGSLRR